MVGVADLFVNLYVTWWGWAENQDRVRPVVNQISGSLFYLSSADICIEAFNTENTENTENNENTNQYFIIETFLRGSILWTEILKIVSQNWMLITWNYIFIKNLLSLKEIFTKEKNRKDFEI